MAQYSCEGFNYKTQKKSNYKTQKEPLAPNGYLYCFSNISMPQTLKIGVTTREPVFRLKEANQSNTWKPPFPYKLEFAKKITNIFEKEKIIHDILSEYNERINPNREFFKTSISVVKKIFDLIEGEYYALKCNTIENNSVDDSITDDSISDNQNHIIQPNICVNNTDEFTEFINWFERHSYENLNGKISLKQLSEMSGLEENKIKQFMKKKGHRYYNFRFPRDKNGKYERGGYKSFEFLYFNEKI
jgi:hypothetical protein